MATESELEMYYATRLSMNLSDGLRALKPVSINAALKKHEMPTTFAPLRKFSQDVVADLVKHKPKLIDWGGLLIDAETDVETYVSRKIWEYKVAKGTFEDPIAAALASTVSVARYARAQCHEAINHSVKHNMQIEHLVSEMHDHIDKVLLDNVTARISRVALAICSLRPELGQLVNDLQPKGITYDSDNA